MSGFRMVHRGHTHIPRFRIVAIKILVPLPLASNACTGMCTSLFVVVRRVREDVRIKPATFLITALDHQAMFVRIEEVVIQKYSPLTMSKLAVAVGHELCLELFLAGVCGDEIFERIG